MKIPTNGGVISTKFGDFNTGETPTYGENQTAAEWLEDYQEYGAHAAVDVFSADNDDIMAVYDGTVVKAIPCDYKCSNGGNKIVIEHTVGDEKFYSYYFHLAGNPSDMLGKKVSAGDVIGTMGSTGTIDKHLHFEVRTEAGYKAGWGGESWWANSKEELNQNWVDISIRFGGYDDDLPTDWIIP